MIKQLTIALFAVVALGFSVGTAVGGGSVAGAKPSLQMIRETPMTIQGRSFRARENVRVSAAGRNWRLRATPRGSFVLALRGVDRCNAVRVMAVGSAGSRAVLKILPAPQCAPLRGS